MMHLDLKCQRLPVVHCGERSVQLLAHGTHSLPYRRGLPMPFLEGQGASYRDSAAFNPTFGRGGQH
jgi:hypothetical protein